MKEFFNQYIDLVTLGMALLWTVAASFYAIKKGGKKLRRGIVPLTFLGPVLLLCCMITHLAEITFNAFDSGFTGKFSLRFHLYSLYLMALVLGNTGIFFYRGLQRYLLSEAPHRRIVLRPAALVAIILFPLLWLTPLSVFMYVACGISIAATFLVRKTEQADGDLDMYSLQEATAA